MPAVFELSDKINPEIKRKMFGVVKITNEGPG